MLPSGKHRQVRFMLAIAFQQQVAHDSGTKERSGVFQSGCPGCESARSVPGRQTARGISVRRRRRSGRRSNLSTRRDRRACSVRWTVGGLSALAFISRGIPSTNCRRELSLTMLGACTVLIQRRPIFAAMRQLKHGARAVRWCDDGF
jgi:hypothetical protein